MSALPRLVRIHDSPLPIKHGAKSDCDLLAAVYLELIKEIDLRRNSENREIVLDIETTGLSPKDERIVEIACVELFGHIPTGRHFQRYVNPCRDVPPIVRRIHGLTEEFLTSYPPFTSIVDDLLAFIGQAPVVSHSDFDILFLNAELARIKHGPIASPCIDTLAMARQRFTPAGLRDLCYRFSIEAPDMEISFQIVGPKSRVSG